jgi:hypothetical protein
LEEHPLRKVITGATAAVGMVLAFGLTTGASLASTTKARHVTFTFLGASVSSTENVYDVRGSGFRGAAIQLVKLNSTATAQGATGGTDTATAYDGKGTTVSKDSFTLSAPDTNGIVTITGSGHFVHGTGKYAHVSGHYTFVGTDNTKTNVINVKATGTESY